MTRRLMSSQLPVMMVAGLIAMVVARNAAAQLPANYHDFVEMDAAIVLLDGAANGRMQVHEIGTSLYGHPIRAVHISEYPLHGGTNLEASKGDRPALLIECGMHAREWAGPELCLLYLQALVLDFAFNPARIEDIIANADIWVIPMVNPDGREVDDWVSGDPNTFWMDPLFHSGDASGWRTNGQLVACAAMPWGYNIGIDIGRNFSAGWSGASSVCTSNQFRGEAPFQAREAQVLRRFVENRMIAMTLSVHSNLQSMGIRTASLGAIRDNMITLWNAAAPSLPLAGVGGVGGATGGGLGQFPGWMADASDTPYEPDIGTRRSAVALLMELPTSVVNYAPPYQYILNDGSNGFHPTGLTLLTEAAAGFANSVDHLAEQARRPWCPLTPGTLTPSAACVNDVGITGAKIAVCTDCVGTLDESPYGFGSRQIIAVAGSRHIVYRIQNFDSNAAATPHAVIRVLSKPTGTVGPWLSDLYDATSFPVAPLASGAAATASVPFTFVSGRDYIVTINAIAPQAETNTQNNYRQFRFIVP